MGITLKSVGCGGEPCFQVQGEVINDPQPGFWSVNGVARGTWRWVDSAGAEVVITTEGGSMRNLNMEIHL